MLIKMFKNQKKKVPEVLGGGTCKSSLSGHFLGVNMKSRIPGVLCFSALPVGFQKGIRTG
jgi:hypothetical protein